MATVTINFNVDVDALREAGVDPETSEGKSQIRDLLLRLAGWGLDYNYTGDHPQAVIARLLLEDG